MALDAFYLGTAVLIQRTLLSTVANCAFPMALSHPRNGLPPDVTSAPMLSVFQNCLKMSLFPIIFFQTVFSF